MSETPSAAQDGERLLLQDASAAERDAGTVHQLDLSSGAASISLGPVVVNEDGTLARVTNWDKMTDGERETTMRVLTKRNASRLKRLQEEEAAKAKEPVNVAENKTAGTDQHSEL